MRAMISRMMRVTPLVLGLVLLAACRMPAQAIPNYVSYQGLLTDATGQPVADNTYQMQFRLYTVQSGGTPFDAFATQNVQTRGGVFSAQIGPIAPGGLIGKSEVWLETWVALPPASLQALSPRAKLASTPFALVAPWSGIEGAPTSFPPSGAAGGDLTGTYPAPTIKADAVTSAKIADGTITSADVSPSAAFPPTGAAGGDLAGTYPAPTIKADAVTSAKIADGTITSADVSPSAAFPPTGAAGGDLAGTYPAPTIKADAVTSAKIADGTITSADLSPSAAIPPTGAAGGDLMGVYPAPTIKTGAVTSAKIADGTIINADISPSAAISDTKIAGTGTVVANLNADRLDGLHASEIAATPASPIKQVLRGTVDFSPGTYDVTATLSPTVNPAKSIVELTGPINTATSQSLNYKACLISLTATQIRIAVDRVISSGNTLRVGYQIVEYN